MRVAAIVPAYPPHSRVGAWLATHKLLAHAAQRGHHVDVFTTANRHPLHTLDGVTVGPGVNLDAAVATCDVVVSHCGDTARAAGLAAKWRKPNVRMVHGGKTTAESLEGAALLVFNSRSLRHATPHAAPSTVIHPPLDVDEFRTTPGDRVTLVNLAGSKGGDVFWRIVRSMPDRRFLGVKGGYGAQLIERHQNSDVQPATDDMRSVYARTRVLLMPSKAETWGMVGVEAMCSGIPVIAHPTPGLCESLGDAGIFVERDSVDGWVAAIERLEDPDEYARCAELARRQAEHVALLDGRDRFVDHLEALGGSHGCSRHSR